MTILRIDGMKCQHCAAAAKKILEDQGATAVIIDLPQGQARFEGTPDLEAFRKALAAKGFTLAD